MKVALGQIQIVMGDRTGNLARALEAAEEAAAAGADWLILPECFDLGWLKEGAARYAEPLTGPTVRSLSRVAGKLGLWVVAGVTELADGRCYNSAVVIDADGRLVHVHRKVRELDFARAEYAVGTQLATFESPFGRMGVLVCADSFGPELPGALAVMGARAILSPNAWAAVPGGEEENIANLESWLVPRTVEHPVWYLGCDGVGELTEGAWRGRVLQGDSLAIAPGGRIVARGPRSAPALVMVDVDLDASG